MCTIQWRWPALKVAILHVLLGIFKLGSAIKAFYHLIVSLNPVISPAHQTLDYGLFHGENLETRLALMGIFTICAPFHWYAGIRLFSATKEEAPTPISLQMTRSSLIVTKVIFLADYAALLATGLIGVDTELYVGCWISFASGAVFLVVNAFYWIEVKESLNEGFWEMSCDCFKMQETANDRYSVRFYVHDEKARALAQPIAQFE